MRTSLMSLAGLLLLSTPELMAGQPLSKQTGKDYQKLSIEQRQELFDARKAWEIKSHDRRIEILQEAQRCIKAADNPFDYRICEKAEGEARRSLRKEALAYFNSTQKSMGLSIRTEKKHKHKQSAH